MLVKKYFVGKSVGNEVNWAISGMLRVTRAVLLRGWGAG